MREILFRGKRTNNGEWIEGSLCATIPSDEDFYTISYFDFEGYYVEEKVIPKTVGQYTGLTDKNDKKIFEDDIVYCKSRLDNANMVVIFECGQFRMILSENYHSYQTNSGFYDINCFDKEVIGNIYDTPELLKGEG